MDHRHMADQHILADDRRPAFGWAAVYMVAGAVAMDHRAVLDIGARADMDEVHVGADHAIIPDADVGADLHVADDPAAGGDDGAGVDFWGLAVEGNDGDRKSKSLNYSPSCDTRMPSSA